MGSVSLKIGEGTARFKRATICTSAVNGLMLFSVLITNLFALYAFTYNPNKTHNLHPSSKNISLISQHVSVILNEIQSSQKKLNRMEKEILGYDTIDLTQPNLPAELKVFLNRHQLPLGKDSRTGITEMVASVGHSCAKSMDLLSEYMNYKVSGQCPDDSSLAQKLILRGCEPLPRRRCFANAKTMSNVEALKKLGKDDPNRFVRAKGKNDFLIDDVLGFGDGGVRIGIDIDGGSGDLAARMAERNVTVITQTLNIDGPYSELIAARGLFPLFLSLDHRFPIYDNVFDLVHAGSNLDVGGKAEKLEFLMFDVDRILRAGGLLWLDNYYCASDEKKKALTKLIERFRYKKLKWVVGEKAGSAGSQIFLSAVLQKPVRA